MAAELDAVLVDDRAGPASEPLPLEERAVVVAGEEARLLALGALGNGEAGSGSLVAGRALALAAERERDAVEQRRVDRREHVGLILGRVVAAGDQPQPVALDDPGVVARPEHVGTGAPGEVDEGVEPEVARCSACTDSESAPARSPRRTAARRWRGTPRAGRA